MNSELLLKVFFFFFNYGAGQGIEVTRPCLGVCICLFVFYFHHLLSLGDLEPVILLFCFTSQHCEVKWTELKSLSHVRLCDPMDCSLPSSSVHGIFQAILLEWIAISFSRGPSRPRDRIGVSCMVDRHFTIWGTRGVHNSIRYQITGPGSSNSAHKTNAKTNNNK